MIRSDLEDQLLWSASKSWDYKVNLGYELQRFRTKDVGWPSILCWGKWLLPKVGAFLWIALHDRILIGNHLKRFGIEGLSWSILCKKDEEMVDHLLLWYPFAHQ